LFSRLSAPGLSRVELKKLFLLTLHMGNYLNHNGNVEVEFLSEFRSEVRKCASRLSKRPEYLELAALARERSHNPLGTTIAWICQIEESKVMQAKTIFTEQYFPVASDLFNG